MWEIEKAATIRQRQMSFVLQHARKAHKISANRLIVLWAERRMWDENSTIRRPFWPSYELSWNYTITSNVEDIRKHWWNCGDHESVLCNYSKLACPEIFNQTCGDWLRLRSGYLWSQWACYYLADSQIHVGWSRNLPSYEWTSRKSLIKGWQR